MTKAMLQCIRPANSRKDGAASPDRAASEKARFRRMLEKLSPLKLCGNPQLNVRSVNFSARPIFSRETWQFGDRRRAEYGKDRAALGPSVRASDSRHMLARTTPVKRKNRKLVKMRGAEACLPHGRRLPLKCLWKTHRESATGIVIFYCFQNQSGPPSTGGPFAVLCA